MKPLLDPETMEYPQDLGLRGIGRGLVKVSDDVDAMYLFRQNRYILVPFGRQIRHIPPILFETEILCYSVAYKQLLIETHGARAAKQSIEGKGEEFKTYIIKEREHTHHDWTMIRLKDG